VFNRGLTRERLKRRGFKQHIATRRREPLAHVPLLRPALRRACLARQQRFDKQSIRRRVPTHAPRRHARHTPFDAVPRAHFHGFLAEQTHQSTSDITETEKAEIERFHT
jgi:hypothetical protein